MVAPGRLDRREAARGDGIPFRLDLPGRSAPRPQVVICLDVSESMWYSKGKIWAARVAAQAIALAVRDAGGDVVGVLFDDTWLIGAGWGDALLFAPAAWPTEGGTYFAFLADLWRRYPHHWVVLVTDGDGYVPYAATPDRARTGAVVIPDGKPEKMAEICSSVIVLKDPRDLPWAMALLIPRAIMPTDPADGAQAPQPKTQPEKAALRLCQPKHRRFGPLRLVSGQVILLPCGVFRERQPGPPFLEDRRGWPPKVLPETDIEGNQGDQRRKKEADQEDTI